MAVRASEQMEWKENVVDIDDVVATICALGRLPFWDECHSREATEGDLDLSAIRDTLQRMGLLAAASEVEKYISATEALSPFVPSLCAFERGSAGLHPRNFALALFGRSPQRFVPISQIAIYPGDDLSEAAAARLEITGTLLEQIQAVRQMLEDREFYPKRALLEALVNCFAHRDYSVREPTQIRIFSDRVEFVSPGGLSPGLTVDTFRLARRISPQWRNRSFAWFFRKLGLAQDEGQGIAAIRSSLKAAGCPPPRFEASEVEVICTLRPNPRGLKLAQKIFGSAP